MGLGFLGNNCLNVSFGVFLVGGLLLVGCQPSAEERYSRAEGYFANANYRASVIELKNAIRVDPSYADARLLLARSAYQLADYPTAESEYIRALALGNDVPDVWLGYGRSLLDQGKAKDALEIVAPNLGADSGNVSILVFVGDVFSSLGNLADAESSYDKALAVDASSDGALIGKAVVAEAMDDSDAARKYLDKAVELNPESPLVWRALGNYFRNHADNDAAVNAYARSMAAESPTTPLAHQFITRINRTSVLLDARLFDEAAEQVDDLSTVLPGHPLMFFLRGRLAYGRGDFDAAQADLREYLAVIPDDLRGQAMLGAINFSQNYLAQAEMYLRLAARENIGGAMTRRMLAETQLRLRKPAEALESLRLAIQDGTSDPILLAMLGRAEIGLGNTDAAISYFEQSVAADPKNPATTLSLAIGLLAVGQYGRAVDVLQSVPEYDDRHFRRETLLIAAYLKNGDRDTAISASDELIQENPDNAEVYAIAGVLRQSLGDAAGATNLFHKAVDLDSGHLAALYGLGNLAIDRSDSADAERWFGKALDVDASFLPALISLSRILSELGRHAELSPRFSAIIDLNPRALAPRLLQARVALANDEFEEALGAINAAKEFHPDDPKLLHAEGLGLLGAGRTETGLRTLALAARKNPDDAFLQYDLASARLRHLDYHGALIAAEDFRGLRPDDLRGLALYVEALARNERRDEAREALADFRATHDDQALTLMLAGDIEMLDNKPSLALGFYQAAADLNWSRATAIRLAQAYQAVDGEKTAEPLRRWLGEHPDDTGMRRVYAQILETQGHAQAAILQYEQLVDRGSNDAVALNNLAWQYAEAGRDGALELAQRAHEIQPDNGSITDTLGWILYREGNTRKALGILREARLQSPGDPEISFHLATVLAEIGDTSAASAILAELLSNNASFPSREQAQSLARTL